MSKLIDLFWLVAAPLTATVACFAFLNITTGMSMGLWLISLAVGYISYRVCVGLDP